MAHSSLPGCIGAKGLSSTEWVPGNSRLLSGGPHGPWLSRGVPFILEHPSGALQSRTRDPWMPHPLLEKGDLLDLNMLDMVRKDPVTPAPAERASLLRPRVEGLISVPAFSEPTNLEPEEAHNQKNLPLCQGEDH